MNSALSFLSAMQQISPLEWAGPCPFCGGKDRFHFWTDNQHGKGQGGRYWCRMGCAASRTSGDGVQLVMLLHGVGYSDAVAMLGGGDGLSLSAVVKGATGRAQGQAAARCGAASGDGVDVGKWQRVAAQFLAHCQGELKPDSTPGPGIIANLIGGKRHIAPATALACGLGYYSGNAYPDAAAWGIPSSMTGKGKIRIPGPGVVIANKRAGQVVSLYVHFDKPETDKQGRTFKGRVVRGSARDVPFLAGEKGLPCFIMESALDAALVLQESCREVSVVGMMGGTKPVDDACLQLVTSAPFVVMLGDNDSNGAGAKAMTQWRTLFPAVRIFSQFVPGGCKDIGEMHHRALMELSGDVPTASVFVRAVLSRCGAAVA